MEALPRLPMLSFELKHSPEYIEFGPTLKQYIKDHYGEDPALYNKACTDLEQLRQAAIQVSRDFMGCTTLKKYYAQLQYLQGRFPMGEGGEAAITFIWEDVQTSRDHVISDIKFEQACILYNIGSLHSLLGALDTRHNAEGMKVSCTHFQCAAWAFEYLRDNFGSSSMSVDMSYELLSFHIILMLAQAQECILEKSMIDNRKNNITAKVAAQVVDFYKDASRHIDLADQKQQINSRMHKEWGRRINMKAAFYQCITYYFLGRQSEEAEKPGECLAYYTAARDELARATQLAKNEVSEVMDCLNFAKDVVMGKYESAKKDNDFVYHEKVPALDSLPEVKGACLVKGIPFNPCDKDISGPDIFQKLVPMEAHEASSIYSEEKAKLSRTVVGDIEQKNMELEQFLSSLQLDVEQLMPKPDLIPEKLMEKCAAMSVRTNAIKELTDSMASVSGLATEVELSIEDAHQLMEQDKERSEQFEKQYGKKKPSSVLPRLEEELTEFHKRHQEGSQLNVTLHKAMNTHTNNLKTLTLPPAEIQAMLPPSQPTLSPEDEAVVGEIRRLMQKVSEMKEQRKALLEQFRDQIHKDDITNVLVTQEKADKESVFAEQLQKHDHTVTYIKQNLSAQDNILRHLTDTNAKYATIRQAYNEAIAKRDKMVQDLILSYEKYEELLAKSQKGVEYYKKLLENVTRNLERCRSECKVRQEERDMLVAKFAPKAPPPSRPLAPKPDPSGAGTPTSVPITPDFSAMPGHPSVLPGQDATSLPPSVAPSSHFQSLPPSFEGPKLKDYLPFMKPRSFGPKAGSATPPQESIPASPPVIPDVPQFDSGDYNNVQRYPGLDPNLASVLPATIAQYLASVSAAGTSTAGGPRRSPSPSSSPKHSQTPTPPRHTPSPLAHATPPASPASFQGPHSMGGPQPPHPAVAARYPSPTPHDVSGPYRSQVPVSQGYPPSSQHPNIPSSYMQQANPALPDGGRHSATPPQSFPGAPAASHPAQAQYSQAYQQYGYLPNTSHPQQYPSMSRHDNTSIVSAVSRPIFSPGQETMNHSPVLHSQGPHMQPQQPVQSSHPQQLPQVQQQYSQQMPQQQQQPHTGQMPFPPNAQYGPSFMSQPQQHGPSQPSSTHTVPPGQHGQQQHLYSQSQIAHVPGQSQIQSGQIQPPQGQLPAPQGQHPPPQGQGQAPPGQGHPPQSQFSQPSMGSQASSGNFSTPAVSAQPFGMQSQIQPLPAQMSGMGQLQGHGYTGAIPQQVSGSSQIIGTGSQQMMNVATQPDSGPQAGSANSNHVGSNQSQGPPGSGQGGNERVPVTSVGYRYGANQLPGPFSAGYAYPNQQWYQSGGTTVYQPTQQYLGGYQHSIGRSYQTAQTFGTFTSKALVYGESGNAISTQSKAFNTETVSSVSAMSASQVHSQNSTPPQIQGVPQQIQGPQAQNQGPIVQSMGPGTHPQGQMQQPHPQGVVPGQTPQGQAPQLQGQVQGPHFQGQMPGPQVQGQVRPPQVQGQMAPGQGQVQGPQTQVSLQGPVQQRFPAPANPQNQQQPVQNYPAQQYPIHPQQLPGAPIPPQQQQQARLPQQQPGFQQQQPGFPHQQQQGFPQQQQQQPGVMAPSQPQSFQPPAQPLQPHQHQQLQQQLHQHQQLQQHQQQLQHQQQQQQPGVRPFVPQQQLPPQGSSQQQVGAPGQPGMSGNMASMQTPLQPSVTGTVRPGTPSQVLSRPSTPGSQVTNMTPPPPSSPIGSKRSVSRQSSSLDDILSSSPNGVKDTIITPQVLTDQERQLQKEEAMKNQAITPTTEPYATQGALNKLLTDVEGFGKFVDELSVTILGVSRLDTVWKSLLDSQDSATKKMSIAIARCYPMKNRDPDIMPYDETRVVLTTTKDDYINASWLNDLAPSCPKFITTQSPIPMTIGEYWAMVYEQGSEVLVQITSEYETGKKFPVYYPTEKDKPMEQGVMLLSLQSVKFRQHWVERIIYLKNTQSKQGRTIVHLQFKNWPVSGFPDDVSSIIHFISEVHSFYMQQRSLTKPIIVHCGSGIGRTGVFILVYTAMQEIQHGNGLVDLLGLARRMLKKRRGILHKKEQLKCCYEAVLCYAEEYLQKRGVLVKNPHFSASKKQITKGSPKHQSFPTPAPDDIVLGTVDLKTIRENVGRLHVHSNSSDMDKKEEMPGSSGHNLDGKSESLSSISNSSLPDVVQQHSDTQSLTDGDRMSADPIHGLHSGSDPLVAGSWSGSGPPSLSSGPASIPGAGLTKLPPGMHTPTDPTYQPPSEAPDGSVPSSLAQLQDPATFTMGTPDEKKKNKITKANFNQAQGSLQNVSGDPTDPFSSLDPMWSLGKK